LWRIRAICGYFYRQKTPLSRLSCTKKRGEASNLTTADARIPAIHGAGDARRLGWRPRAVISRMLPIRSGQMVAWVVAAIVAALTFPVVGQPARIVFVTLAVLVFGTTSVRLARRHLAGWTLTWISYRLLRHDDRRLGADPLLVLAPDLRLRQHADRAGNRFGIAGVGDGWIAVVKLRPAAEPDVGKVADVLRHACDNADIPLAGAQLVLRTEGEQREYLLAVRYRSAEAPLAALARGSGELGEHRATTRAALGVVGALAETGCPSTVLEAGELAAELRRFLGVQGRSGATADGWRSWSAGNTTQACFGGLCTDNLQAVFLAQAPTAGFTVTSYMLHRTALGRLREDVMIRVVHQGTETPPSAADLDVPAVPLYGRHESAVRRTLPLALPR
jgi:type VII secretion protein EccE